MAKVTREKFKVFEGVFDEFTLNTLESLKRRKYFDELKYPIKTGKEGDVYYAIKDGEIRAIKIYRITTANFKKISVYIQRDFRFRNIKGNLRKVILAWAQKEFRNIMACHKENMNVPFVFKQENNVIIMEYIDGFMLKDVLLENPIRFFNQLIEQLKIMKNQVGLIHADLSEFNIMVKDEMPYIIDMGQGIIIKNQEDFQRNYSLFERDVKNVCDYFNKKYKMKLNYEEVINRLDS